MNITQLELTNFRCFDHIKLNRFSNLNIIIGKNGIGKTSVVESIFIGSLTKSFKSISDLAIIKNNKNFYRLKIKLFDEMIIKNLEIYVDNMGKKVKINNKIIPKFSNFISQYNVILVSPDEIKLIKSSPINRRNYLNMQISQLNKEYIELLNSYNVLIKNKNNYLKQIDLLKNIDYPYLDILDKKISKIGYEIYKYRNEYICNINKYINNIFSNFNKKDLVKIEYKSDFANINCDDIEKLLHKYRNKDISLRMSTIGIHHDDFAFIHNNMDAKEYSSQGYQKILIYSFKFSEVKIFKEIYNRSPIVILDDVFSELDTINRNKLFKIFDYSLQTFITTTDLNNINKKIINKAKIFEI